MKQYVLAIHNHHDTLGVMPASRTRLPDPHRDEHRASIHLLLFPFMEQAAAWDSVLQIGVLEPPPLALRDTVFSTFGCPSDPNFRLGTQITLTGTTTVQVPRSNIVYSAADTIRRNNFDSNNILEATRRPEYEYALGRAPFAPDIIPNNIGSINFRNPSPKEFTSITDGLSNTIAISEVVTSASNRPRSASVTGSGSIRSGVVQATNATDLHGNPQTGCLERRDPGSPYFYRSGLTSWEVRGAYIAWGFLQYSGFCTVLPPNSPSCSANSGLGSIETDGFGLASAASYHTGGVNVGMLDGGVRFITENINCGSLNGPPQMNGGESNYGLWGSMGSINGNESHAMP